MPIRSIGARLTVWYTSILTVTLLVLGGVAYGLLAYSLSRDIDSALSGVAEVMVERARVEGSPFFSSEVVGFYTRPAALVTCGMNIMFIVAIAMALAAELQLQCGCFASAEAGDQMDSGLIIRDAIFLSVGIVLVVLPPDRLTLDNFFERRKQHA